MIESDYFRTGVRNFFEHNPLGNSNIFFPLTIARARIRAFEVTARSPLLFGRGRFHLAYSRQKIEGQGAVTGGLTDFAPPENFFLLDHDQRHTLSIGFIIDASAFSATARLVLQVRAAMESAFKCLRADDSYQIFRSSSTWANYFWLDWADSSARLCATQSPDMFNIAAGAFTFPTAR